ncbi:hypothetical protein QWZ08_11110 [Ferruginibacter paludis]|uniref:hypothetical protein n=1 Tax=Ferruginibacter paludis TaxID=1310417 RepID=UPI0025B61B3B|nr:hypothetical protein [Ferruginibacter paludis]MDN3656179.1 hypothetical protein [Ferruginibacter paludis]
MGFKTTTVLVEGIIGVNLLPKINLSLLKSILVCLGYAVQLVENKETLLRFSHPEVPCPGEYSLYQYGWNDKLERHIISSTTKGAYCKNSCPVFCPISFENQDKIITLLK